MGRGMFRALPMKVPATHESVHDDHEKQFTQVARSTDQSPARKRFIFTPKLSSVMVAAKKNESGRGTSLTHDVMDVEYRMWRMFTSDTLATIEATGEAASHMLGIMN